MIRAVAILAVAAAFAAIAQTSLPSEVAQFVQKRDECDHFRGEEPYDAERRAFIEQKMLELCAGSDRRLVELRKKYSNDRAVREKLDSYEDRIEPASQ